MGDPLKGKLAAVLQTSALGGPTLSTRIEAHVDISRVPGYGQFELSKQGMYGSISSPFMNKLKFD